MPREYKVKVDTARAIKGILDQYPAGNGILRELIQNSDDAAAKKQIFILDCRSHPKVSLVDAALAQSQGPALLAVNDTVFTDTNWEALATISASDKVADETKAGKYGLGMKAAYHITEHLQVLSGATFAVFDPQDQFQAPFTGGCRIDFVKEGQDYPDQLAPFLGVINTMSRAYEGTVVRLPFRTPQQAARTRIKNSPTTMDDIRSLFMEFIEKELEIVMLFLKHITTIELQEITADGKLKVLANVTIDDSNLTSSRAFTRGATVCTETFKSCVRFRTLKGQSSRTWRIYHSIQPRSHTNALLKRRLQYDVEDELVQDKLFAHVALAYSLDGPRVNGKLFTLLPLPIVTGFPLHTHAVLALTPDRQSLRNKQEEGFSLRSRERLLVEWNQVIFDEYLPSLWIKLLEVLIREDGISNIWSAWPMLNSTGTPDSSYWGRILHNILRVSATEAPYPAVFPSGQNFVTLTSGLIAEEKEVHSVTDILRRIGVTVIVVPESVSVALRELKTVTLHEDFTVENVYKRLLQRTNIMSLVPNSDKDIILDYLVSPTQTLQYVSDLPLIPLVDGSRIALRRRGTCINERYLVVSTTEEELFRHHAPMIPLPMLPPRVQTAFSGERLSKFKLNAEYLAVDHVIRFLNQKFAHFDPSLDEVPCSDDDIEWTVKFWDWIYDSSSADQILRRVDQFHLLPTSSGTLRKVNSRIPLPITDPNAAVSWSRLGVPFLHKDAPTKSMAKHQKIILNEDVPALISLVETDKIPTLDKRSFSFVKKHIIASFQAQKHSAKLNALQLAKYKHFPIFPLRAPQTRSQWAKGFSRTYDGAVDGKIEFVHISDRSPVPTIDGTALIDVSKSTRILALGLDPQAVSKALDEVGVLRLAVRHLNMQSSDNIDALTHRIIPRLNDLCQDTEIQNLLRGSRIVPLSNGLRSRPQDLIYPSSIIADLYEGEQDKFPSPSFYSHLPAMQVHNFFQATLTVEVVTGRIQYISRFGPDSTDPRMRKKAKLLLELLDRHWSDSFSGISSLSQAPWLPVETGGFSCSTMSRDMNRRELFDQVLLIVDAKLANPHLRAALGWDKDVPFNVLFQQFLKTLEQNRNEKRNEQLFRIIKYMIPSVVQGSVSGQELAGFKEAVADKKWIPVSKNECTDVQHAMLSRRFKPIASFSLVPMHLIENDGDVFFKIMGCADEPSLESMIAELQNHHPIPDVVAILQYIANHPDYKDTQDIHRERVLIPTRNDNFRPSPQVYFEDISTTDILFISSELLPAHPLISRDLASKLKLLFSSSIALGDEDEDEEQMAEDLMHRIESVCSDYGIEYAFNEFLANAVDAGAQKFGSLIDERTFPKQSIISPAMNSLQGPALLLFNDKPFTDNDFIGIRRIGRGGKLDNPNTIGRFGLGALSLFNFTNVVTIVSRGRIMMLDPSGSYLPTMRGRARTCLFRKISDISSRYPDQIVPFQGLFKFSSESDYQGTIFRLPLKAGVDIYNLMKGAYLKLAENALFFTCLHEISAWIYPPSGEPYPMWQIKGSRSNLNLPHLPLTEQDVFNAHELELTMSLSGGEVQQHWIISKLTRPVNSLPADCIPVLQTLKLDRSAVGLTICLALCRKAKEILPFSLFSGLRLPERVSLPVHLNAPFSLASDRRNIRLDPPDANGHRTHQSVYNHWILNDLVPHLYLWSLAYTYERYNPAPLPERQPLWWPCNPADEVSRIVTQGFYSLLPNSSERVFRSIDGKLLSSRGAVFSDEEPYRITSLLKFMKTESTVFLPYDVRSLILRNDANPLTFQRVSADFLINAIRQSPRKFLTFVEKGFVNPALDLDSVTNFILSGCTTIPWDISLLFTEAHSCIPLPTLLQPPLYFYSLDKLPSIFPASRFLHHELQQSTVVLLQEKNVNILPFDFAAVESLVVERLGSREDPVFYHSKEDAEWIRQFWQLCAQSKLPRPVSDNFIGSVISRLPLLQTYDGVYVSLTHCLQSIGNVLPDPAASEYDLDGARIANLMGSMGVHVLRKTPSLLSEHISNFSLNAVLACIHSQVPVIQISSLSESDRNEFARWVRSQLGRQSGSLDDISADLKQTLFQLPIWPARRGGLYCLVSSCDLKMLPPDISLSDVTEFLKSNVPVAKYSLTLHHKCGKVAIDLDQLFSIAEVPDILPLSEVQRYRSFLNTILRWPVQLQSNRVSVPLRVPNSDGSMILVRSLYDSDVHLFSQALESSRFPHPDLRNLHHDLRSWGLRHEINYDSFYECANTIDKDVRYDRNQDNIIDRARTVYHCYNHTLPLLRNGALSTYEWSGLNNLYFIPRNAIRRHNATYETDNYVSLLPDVLSPAQIVREEFEAVAWTQRGLVESEHESRPSRPLLAKNSSFGVPSANEVMDHLVVLSTRIAPGLGYRNQSLRADLYATYTWLTNQLPARATYLKSLVHPTEPLFLNVDDPNTDRWVWHGTSCLIFNLPYPEKGREPVRQFLQEFKPLLLALGAHEVKDAKRIVDHEAASALNVEQLREAFNTMRKEGRLTDIKLMPSNNECEDFDTDSLSAHASFLAASVAHFSDALGGAWREKGEFHFDGTFFQAKAVLDFLYTGEMFEEPRTPKNEDEAEELLRDLLELLELTEQWQMMALKSKVETIIIDYRLITLDTWKHILDEAEKLTARSLVRSCKEFEKENRNVIESITTE